MMQIQRNLLRFVVIAFVMVCGIGTAQAQCPQEVPAQRRGGIAPNGPFIAGQCQEACPNWVAGTYLSTGQGTDYLDYILVRCSDANNTEAVIWSYPQSSSTASDCWNCVGGCAGANCPPGELCLPVPRETGSDCQRFGCPAGYSIAERTVVVGNELRTEAYCTRNSSEPCVAEIEITLDGPSSIQTGGNCTWSATATGGTGASKTFSWYAANHWAGSGQYYTGGRPSGTLIGHSWRVRVDVTDGTKYASKEILVSESSSAPPCIE